MLLLELLQHLQLLTLVARRQSHLLLPLIVHHLLHHAPRLPVQVPQFRILGLDLARVEEVRRVRGHAGPPLHLVGFVQVDGDFFARGAGSGLERPGGFVGVDLMREGALERGEVRWLS